MSELSLNFEPYSDVAISDSETISAHKELVNQYSYTEATEKINNDTNLKKKGWRASFFNAIEQKIQALQIYLLNKNACPDEYYSLTEPSEEFMTENGKVFWIKPIE